MSLSLAQRLGLAKYLTDRLAEARKKELEPQAAAEMPSGTRLPVMFGGRLAGWVTMPEPSKRAAWVSDEDALLAWARRHYPEKVEPAVEVAVDDDLIAFLAEHYPQALREGERVQPAWLGDILSALRGGGKYVTGTGEILTGVPGITVPESDPPVPRVALDKQAAAEVIGAAWRAGLISADELLALPPAGEDAP
jgi:hypothetical protein